MPDKKEELSVGDIIVDSIERYGTIINLTKRSITIKYEHSTQKMSFQHGKSLENYAIRLVVDHRRIIDFIKQNFA